MMGLTRRQRDLLDFIGAYMATENVAPSYQEMADGLGVASKNTVHRLVDALVERGCIGRLANRARAIEILKTTPPLLKPVKARPLSAESTDSLIAELEARGFLVERIAA